MIENIETYTRVPNRKEHTCFACGQANPYGLQLKFYSDKESVFCKYKIPTKFVGWDNLAHGGILSTILDEVMAWTVIFLEQKYILTKSLSVDFLKKITVGQEIFARGKIIERPHARSVIVLSEIFDEAGELAVRGKAEIILFSKESFRSLGTFNEKFLDEFEEAVFGSKS